MNKLIYNPLIILLSLSLFTISFSSEVEKAKEILKKGETQRYEESLTQFDRGYILLKRNQFEVENSLSYIYYSANQIYLSSFAILDPIFLTLGEFGIENARRHIFQYGLSFRYGIADFLQAEVNVPFIYRHERYSVVGANKSESTADDYGIGDVSVALSIQPLKETKSRPAVIFSLSFKTKTGKSPFKIDNPRKDLPTGSGYYAVRGGLNFLKSIDPVVVFGGFAYSYNMPEKVGRVYTLPDNTSAKLDKFYPGDTVSLNMGFAYALSYNFSMNFQFAQDYTFTSKSKVNGIKSDVNNSTLNSAVLKIGTGWAISSRSSFNVSVSMGLTADAPDYVLEFRIPVRF
ncbi:transporter [Persephonella sp.]